MQRQKTLLLILISQLGLFLYPLGAIAQNMPNNCNTTVGTFIFEQRKREFIAQTNELQRLNLARNFVRTNCLTSTQLKDLCSLFLDDFSRLELAKDAYATTFDKPNFYEVYNAFTTFSVVFMLHDFVLAQRQGISPAPTNPNFPTTPTNPNFPTTPTNPNFPANPTTPNITFPNWVYPNPMNYTGTRNCSNPIAENDFMVLAQSVHSRSGDNPRLLRINEILTNNCWSVAQVMRLVSLIDSEVHRLNILKSAYQNTFDIENYNQTTQLLNLAINQQDLQNFVRQQQSQRPVSNTPTTPPCAVEATNFEQMRRNVARESFENTKMTLIKQLLRTHRCFTTTQIGEFMKQLAFDDNKLDIAQTGYEFCIDKQNYTNLTSNLAHRTNRDKLLSFLANQK